MSTWPRFFLALALLIATALFLHSRRQPEVQLPREAVNTFPERIGDWVGQTFALQEDVLKVLGAGEFLQRIYVRRPEEPGIDFFLAFFPSQRTGDTIHSPQNCLPGAGWAPTEAGRKILDGRGGMKLIVNRYVISKGLNRQLVLYWYQSHGRVVASEYRAKFYLVADSISMNRTDGALVRVITPLARGETTDRGEQRAVEFTQQILPLLDSYIPR